MNDQRQTIARQGSDAGPASDDEAIGRLSRRIADLYESLGRVNQARADCERTGGRTASGLGGPSLQPWRRPGDPPEVSVPPMKTDGYAFGLCEAYRDRGRARLGREEYHLALDDFATALCLHPYTSLREFAPEYWGGRYEALGKLSEAFPTPREGSDGPTPDEPAPGWMVRSIPAGHLVVGDNVILGHYPATTEGRWAAVRHADRLAGDAEARSFFDNRYLTESHEFDVLVYAFDGARLRLEHQAPFEDDHRPGSGTDDVRDEVE